MHLAVISPATVFGCDSFSDLPCFRWPWKFWGVLVRYFAELSSVGICLLFFPHDKTGALHFGRKDTEGESACRHIVSRVHTSSMTCHYVTPGPLAECLSVFPSVKVPRSPHPPYGAYGKKPLCTTHTLGFAVMLPHSRAKLYINYWAFFCMEDVSTPPIYLFIQSSIYISMGS